MAAAAEATRKNASLLQAASWAGSVVTGGPFAGRKALGGVWAGSQAPWMGKWDVWACGVSSLSAGVCARVTDGGG